MKNLIFLAILLIGTFAANSQSILPENPDNLAALVISATSNGMQHEWSANSGKHQFADLFPGTDNSTDLEAVTSAKCKCNVTVTNNITGQSKNAVITLVDCPETSGALFACKISCKEVVANKNASGPNTYVLNSWSCE